ncbi:13216_t:CDS:2 [Funneliformis geosporum]|uniref:13216_t:CDS:1 n=1 Tax=Funneliformis geosporum TaxID=1117311 RepID=A0A9W4X7Y9_9GLOM|nr:13216_t:CDS:2 [Funneliformis geosporum]
MTTKLTWEEHRRIKDIKILDLELCDYGHMNILNLGWEANIIGCELTRKRSKRTEEPIKPNCPYDLASCYLCRIGSAYKILCLECIGKEFYQRMSGRKLVRLLTRAIGSGSLETPQLAYSVEICNQIRVNGSICYGEPTKLLNLNLPTS